MRRSILVMLALCGILSVATSASALYVGATDVGGKDVLVSSTYLSNSGDAFELAWITSVLGGDAEWEIKYDVDKDDWSLTNEAGTYAMALSETPEYYLIKTATSGSLNNVFLFDNHDSLEWAVLNLSESFGEGYLVKNVGKFSHVVETNNNPVPEPGTFILLGAGLFGLAIFGKRRMNKDV